MIHLCYSNRTEALIEALARNLADERARRGPFAPLRLVVPNRNVETYVKLRLAEAHGVAANLDVAFLRERLARVVAEATPETRVPTVRQVQGRLLALLHDERLLGASALVPVREYLEAAGRRPEAIDRRRCQLAAELAHLYDEYAHARPEMLSAWRDGGEPSDPLERWQRALWLRVFDGGALTLFEAVTAAAAVGALRHEGALHVFGVSYVARGYHRMLEALARAADVRVYTLNPCREFWEDVDTVAELRRRVRKAGRASLFPARRDARQPALALGDDPLGLTADGESLALRLWGRPGRENVRLLNQMTDGDFEPRFVASGGQTLLGRLQDEILDRAPAHAPDPALRADGSITVLPCPGLRRELEVVAAEIWRLLRADPGLRFNDIAVVVPEGRKEVYLSHVGAVFGEAHELPHSVVDLPLGGGHRLGEAVQMLIDLPAGSFSRRELLPLVTHPSVMGRFPAARPADFLRLVDELGIVHGADHTDHAGTYIERDLLNWDQGLRRLALGALMIGARGGDETPVRFGDEGYLPADLPADEQAAALQMALLCRSLLSDARFFAAAARPLGEWLDGLRGMLGAYLVPADDAEQALLGRCLAALDELEELDLGDVPVAYRVAAELATQALSTVGGGRGQYLARGVTVASFVPMRAIPFRMVFVLGLGHGEFPSARRHGELDLRARARKLGDVSAREQDLYMFLETLLCARERVVLSYVARDELTGEPLAPSAVLLELRDVLAQHLVPDELTRLFDPPRPPLRRYDDGERLEALPMAQREHVAKALGRSLRAALPADAALPDLPALVRALPAETAAALAARLDLHAAPSGARRRTPARGVLQVTLGELRRFLEDPLQGSARFRLRMREREGDEEVALRDEEAFETASADRAVLLRRAITDALLVSATPAWPAVVDAYQAAAAQAELAGRAPTGFFGRAERPVHEAVLRLWLDQVLALAGRGPARILRFGRAAENERAVEIHRAIALDLPIETPPLRVEIVGGTELLLDGALGRGSLLLSAGRKPRDKRDAIRRRRKTLLRAFVDHLALAAAGVAPGPHAAFLVTATDDDGPDRARFAPIEPEAACAYLGTVVTDMLLGVPDAGGAPTGMHPYLLPCEAVLELGKEAAGQALVAAVEELRDDYFERPSAAFSSVWGPVPQAVERHHPPPAAEAAQIAGRRFGLYFESLEEEAS